MANYSLGDAQLRENRRTFDRVVVGTHNIEQPNPRPELQSSLLLLPRA